MKKIVIRVEEDNDDDCFTRQTLFANDEEIANVNDLQDCPEDAIIGRDLVDCNDIQEWIRYGYDAAKRGDELVFE